MCGIVGLIPDSRRSWPQNVLHDFMGALRHRGPDDFGFLRFHEGYSIRGRAWNDELPASTVLAHHRLSILDLSTAGWQPMSTPDQRFHLAFNGEIYNYRELRSELQACGHSFSSKSDTEVLLYALAEWGIAALPKLVGMFAFAFLDVQAESLLLARDQFGVKPLYYSNWDGGFGFASEIKALLKLPGVSRAVDPQRLLEYLRFGLTDHGSRTLLRSVQQLPAAHYLQMSLKDSRPGTPCAYWQLNLEATCDLSFEAAAERLRELFLESISLHMRSDVAVGAALSGGVDSSSIVAAMRMLEPQLELHTFSYVAEGTAVNEESYADIVAGYTHATSHKIRVTADELARDLPELIAAQDEPFGSTSIYSQYRVFRAAKEAGIKVMLDGQGADEILGGYRHYQAARLAGLVRRGKWIEATRFAGNAMRHPTMGLPWLTGLMGEYLLPVSLQHGLRRLIGRELLPSWLDADWFHERGCSIQPTRRATGPEAFKEELHRSLTETMLPHLLRYEDRNSMHFSIESRVPFLTPQLAQFSFSLPDDYLISSDGTTKAVFRRAMRGITPDAILNRRDKVGFETPEQDWLQALRPWADRILQSESARKAPCFRFDALQREWQDICAGRRYFNHRAWRWLNFLEWADTCRVDYDK